MRGLGLRFGAGPDFPKEEEGELVLLLSRVPEEVGASREPGAAGGAPHPSATRDAGLRCPLSACLPGPPLMRVALGAREVAPAPMRGPSSRLALPRIEGSSGLHSALANVREQTWCV